MQSDNGRWSSGAAVELRVSGKLSPRHGPPWRRALRPGRRGYGDRRRARCMSCQEAPPGRRPRGRSDGTAGGRACSRRRPTSTQPLPNSSPLSGVGTTSRRSFRARIPFTGNRQEREPLDPQLAPVGPGTLTGTFYNHCQVVEVAQPDPDAFRWACGRALGGGCIGTAIRLMLRGLCRTADNPYGVCGDVGYRPAAMLPPDQQELRRRAEGRGARAWQRRSHPLRVNLGTVLPPPVDNSNERPRPSPNRWSPKSRSPQAGRY
jgi:hypothetical protein